MKKVIIIILAILLAADLGVVVYGITRGPAIEYNGEPVGCGLEPAKSVYTDLQPDGAAWVSLDTILAVNNPAEKAARLIVDTMSNLISSSGFYCSFKMQVQSGDNASYSENFRVAHGTDEFYQTLTSASRYEKRQVRYSTAYLEQADSNALYNAEKNTFKLKLNSPSVDTREPSLKSQQPYTIYSWFDLPLYLGAKGSDTIVYDVIDGSTVNVKDDGNYYTLTFSAIPAKANEKETKNYVFEGLGGKLAGVVINEIYSVSIKAEIWKSGLFRSMAADVSFNGKLNGQTGDAEMKRTYDFSYHKQDVSVAYWLKSLNWARFLQKYPEIVEMYEAEIKSLEK